MAKLCYKVNGTVKKYDLKDNVNKPRLAVKSGGTTKYLGLKQGTKSGELSIKVGGQPYYVQTAVTIGNAQAKGKAYNQTIRDYNHSVDDERILSWLFVNPVNNQIMAMIVYAHTEGNCMGVVQHLSANYQNGTGGTNASNGIQLTYRNGIFGQDFAPSDAPVLSGNIKIGLVNEFSHRDISTKTIHDYLVDSNYDSLRTARVSYKLNNHNQTYYKNNVDCRAIFNHRDNTKTASKSSIGNFLLPISDFWLTVSADSSVATMKSKKANSGDWFIGDSPFAGVKTGPSDYIINPPANTYNFLVGLYQGYPMIEMGSISSTHRSVLAYIEFPYSGYMGMKPYDVIDAWYAAMGDRTYTLSTDHSAFSNNGRIIYYPGDELIDM